MVREIRRWGDTKNGGKGGERRMGWRGRVKAVRREGGGKGEDGGQWQGRQYLNSMHQRDLPLPALTSLFHKCSVFVACASSSATLWAN